MKHLFLSLILTPILANHAHANSLIEPDLNQCSSIAGITKCEIVCKRSLGNQCLITHINFEGQNLKTENQLLRVKFQTCKNANLDLQISSLAVELEKLDQRESNAKITVTISASGNKISLKEHPPLEFNNTQIDARLGRVYFNEFINSGEDFVEAEISLKQCGHEDSSNSCKLHGKLIAVTDPNIRCDFHDTTKPGAFRSAQPQLPLKLGETQQYIGRIGE